MVNQNRLLLGEAFDVISCTTIFGVFYGLAFSLYCLCASSLYPKIHKIQNPDQQRQARFQLGYISFLFFCATGYLTLSARVIQLAYINHANFPGGPFAYEGTYGSVVQPYQVTIAFLEFIIEVLIMAIQLRRMWIIWSTTQYAVVVTILPVLLLLGYMALDIIIEIVFDFVLLPDLSVFALGTASFAIASSFTALVTGLMAVRLLLVRRQLTKIMGTSDSPYLSIVTVLVESYALESAWSLAGTISFALVSPSYLLFEETDVMVKIIAYFLVVYRVQQGKGWTKQTEGELTSLQFDRGAQSATDKASSLGSELPATTSKPGIGSLTLNSSDSSA